MLAGLLERGRVTVVDQEQGLHATAGTAEKQKHGRGWDESGYIVNNTRQAMEGPSEETRDRDINTLEDNMPSQHSSREREASMGRRGCRGGGGEWGNEMMPHTDRID